MAHRTKNKGPGWIGSKGDDQMWYWLRTIRRRTRNKIAKASRRINREANRRRSKRHKCRK